MGKNKECQLLSRHLDRTATSLGIGPEIHELQAPIPLSKYEGEKLSGQVHNLFGSWKEITWFLEPNTVLLPGFPGACRNRRANCGVKSSDSL